MSIKKFIKKVIRNLVGLTHLLDLQVIVNVNTLSPNELLKGRTALITGGTTGIGKAIVKEYLKAGANVIFTSRSQSKCDAIVLELRKEYPNRLILGYAMDNKNVSSFQPIFSKMLEDIGDNKISILVNNAGIGEGWWCHTTEQEFDDVMATNLKGPFFLTEIVAKYMIANKVKGNILNICSSAGLRPANTAYRFSKWSMRGFTLGLAKILIKEDIVVNGIAPGPTATAMMGSTTNEHCEKPKNPNKRMAAPEEIANMAVIYVSDMARTIVGDIAYMSGGGGVITVDDNDIYYM